MKKYEKIIAKMVKEFAEKGLIQCNQVLNRKIMDYLNYMGIAVVRANEQTNTKFILDEPMKEIITSIVDKQWKLFKETTTGYELVNFYENEDQMERVVKTPEELDKFLSTVTSKKMINELFLAFVKNGDLESVKKLVEKTKSPKIKSYMDICILAVEHNQYEILDYLYHKDKHQTRSEQTYLGIYARKSMDYDAHDVFKNLVKKIVNIDELLSHAVFYELKEYAY